MDKKGGIHWEYLVAIILVLLIIVIGLMFLKFGKETGVEKASGFFNNTLKIMGR